VGQDKIFYPIVTMKFTGRYEGLARSGFFIILVLKV